MTQSGSLTSQVPQQLLLILSSQLGNLTTHLLTYGYISSNLHFICFDVPLPTAPNSGPYFMTFPSIEGLEFGVCDPFLFGKDNFQESNDIFHLLIVGGDLFTLCWPFWERTHKEQKALSKAGQHTDYIALYKILYNLLYIMYSVLYSVLYSWHCKAGQHTDYIALYKISYIVYYV